VNLERCLFKVKRLAGNRAKRKDGKPCAEVSTWPTGGSRELSVAYVLRNDKENQKVEAQGCRTTWTGTSVRHRKEYRRTNAEEAEVVLEPTEEPVRIYTHNRALVKAVELYLDGRMMQSDATALSKGGWSL
jgi:hypothetical protein